MTEQEAHRLLQAAKTAVSLIGLVHQAMWELYPDETLLLSENSENQILKALCIALRQISVPMDLTIEGPST
jgi:hypothetical protein